MSGNFAKFKLKYPLSLKRFFTYKKITELFDTLEEIIDCFCISNKSGKLCQNMLNFSRVASLSVATSNFHKENLTVPSPVIYLLDRCNVRNRALPPNPRWRRKRKSTFKTNSSTCKQTRTLSILGGLSEIKR